MVTPRRPVFARPRRRASALLLALGLLACKPRGENADTTAPAGPAAPVTAARTELGPNPVPAKNGEDEAAPDWDVSKPFGPTRTVSLDVEEGTWMNLDISPDGKTLVFDLLGDLYTLPVEGGEARSLTAGLAWDMQPRFSPDGEWVAFTSDRGGGDNLWVMPAAGGDARAVTREDFRLVNSPAWSPDGRFLVGHKHFTAERSLGSGEVWLYHLSGGKGTKLTTKPNDQQDVGEPALSPDGRFLYFSQDTTPGPLFSYNKDPHAGIYSIKRVDLQEHRTEVLLGGPGGAVRPTPSPDGTRLAYVRRRGLKTVLFVVDLESGAEQAIHEDLDRDMQETWAIHGVYPAMAWTPDGGSVVLWAGGKIRRVDVKTRQSTVIPFHVKDTRTVIEAVRFPVEVHPETFETKMHRWATASPDGQAVVFQALGQLYLHDLRTGKSRRVTKLKGVFEHYPAFSRDGKQLAFTTWSDEQLGHVRVVPTRGGRVRTVSRKPGHYLQPAWSPDGKTLVVQRAKGGYLRSKQWSRDPGLYALPSGGGPATLVSREGRSAHFGADGRRVYFVTTERDSGSNKGRSYPKTKTVLRSIGLDGKDQRTHLSSEWADDFVVSPDERWVAFRERFHVYLRPFTRTGTVVQVGPNSDDLPQARITRDAGDYLHWSGDSQRLHWSLGPELYTRELKDAFAFVEGAPEQLPEPPAAGVSLAMTVSADVPEGRVALVGGRIVTMKGQEVFERGTVLVERNRIVAVGKEGEIEVPRDAHRVDTTGMTVIPGIVDVHAHGAQGTDGIIPQHNWLHYAELAFGVTTVHDPSNDTATIFAAAELVRAGRLTAPRIFSTGTILYGARNSITAEIDSLDDARRHLRRMKAVGAWSVKSYNQPRRDQRQQVLTAARELGMMVVPEGGSLYQHNMTMIVDGHTGVEHAIPVARGYDDVEQLWGGTEVGYTPTLVVGYGGLSGEFYWYAHQDVFAHPRLSRFVPPFVLESRSRRRLLASRGDWNHFEIARLCKQLLDAGVKVNIGAHGQREGLAAHWELWMLAQGGMTPHEALRAATLHGAEYLGLDRDIGSIEIGKLADLAVIDGNPLADIRDSEKVRYTMVNGRLYDARTMDQRGNHPQTRPPLFWEREGGHGHRDRSTATHHRSCSCGLSLHAH